MSVILRSLLRDPLVTRPLSRALRRRFDDDVWHEDHWPAKRSRRDSVWESPVSIIDDMNRQMTAAVNRMHELTEDLDTLDSWVSDFGDRENRPRNSRRRREDALLKRTESGGLQLALDVSDFKPDDLKIKLVDDNLVIEGNSVTSGKDSYRQTQFKRWFKLPEDCKLDEIKSKLTSDNRLVIDLPANKPNEQQQSRSIPIQMEHAKQDNQSGTEALGSSK